MKRSIKFLLVAALSLGTTSLFAQKMGRIDYGSILESMPEMTQVTESIEKLQTEYETQLEELQVEINNKINDFQNAMETMTEPVKQMRTREINELQQRYQDYLQVAQQTLDQTHTELMTPIQEKINAAIKKVCKAEGIVVVFQAGSVIYIDEEATSDITAKVKAELGIKE